MNSSSANRYGVMKSQSGVQLTNAINKMKENTKYIGGGEEVSLQPQNSNIGSGSKNTTPNSKHKNRYAGHQ